jgi:serine protease Do
MAVHKAKTLFVVLGLLALPMLSGCGGADPASSKVTIVHDDAIRKTFVESVEKRMKDSPSPTPNKTLIKQLSRTECVIDNLPAAGTRTLSPQEIYQQAVRSTVVMGTMSRCPKGSCKTLHASFSSAVIIHEDGIVATNYHVVNSPSKGLGMAIMTHDGRVFLVDEVLAASKDQDVALVKVRNPSGLTAAPIFRDEPVGAPITVISHPNGKFYMLTQGYVSRYAAMGKKIVMNITADYARGSSGGPFFNSRGDLVGLVSSTSSLAAKKQHLTVGEDNQLFFGHHSPKRPKTKSPAKKKPVAKVSEEKGSEAKESKAKGSDANVSATKKPVKKASPKKKEQAKKPQHKKRKTVVLTNGHQMTVKNGVPSREILNLIKSP